jgi:hypothetical protein
MGRIFCWSGVEMPRREDERARNLRDDALRWCTVCEKWFSPIVAEDHNHYPAMQSRQQHPVFVEIDPTHLVAPEIRGLSSSWKVKRIFRKFKRITKHFLARLIVISFITFVSTSIISGGYHWYGGTSVEDSMRMTIDDFRVLATCPTNVEVIVDFVQRPANIHSQILLTAEFGSDWITDVCNQHALELFS